MLNALKFVKSAFSASASAPLLSYCAISHGFVKAYNGRIAACSPIPCDLVVNPNAAIFFAAIGACKETPQLSVTDKGSLFIQSGPFSVTVPTTAQPFPALTPEGLASAAPGGLREALAQALPFVSTDTGRAWANGILLQNGSALATDNQTAIEVWTGLQAAPFNLPREAAEAVLCASANPVCVQLAAASVTFHYPGGAWLRSHLHPTAWPDVAGLIDRAMHTTKPDHVPDSLFSELRRIKPFVKDGWPILLRGSCMSTGTKATVIVPGMAAAGAAYTYDHLCRLEDVAARIAFAAPPAPLYFDGPGLRGVIACSV